jgi:N-acetylglutamate synthase-like GNAT family acetyltransferase
MLLRSPKLQDSFALVELVKQLGYPSSQTEIETRLKELLASELDKIIVAEEAKNQSCIAYIHLKKIISMHQPNVCEVVSLVVNENYRGQGIGKLLMKAGEEWSRYVGSLTTFLRSNIKRDQAHNFYKELGYVQVGTSHKFEKSIKSIKSIESL